MGISVSETKPAAVYEPHKRAMHWGGYSPQGGPQQRPAGSPGQQPQTYNPYYASFPVGDQQQHNPYGPMPPQNPYAPMQNPYYAPPPAYLPNPHMGRPTNLQPPSLPPTQYGYQTGVTPPPGLQNQGQQPPQSRRPPKHDLAKRYEGTVKLFHLEQGFGFINCAPIYQLYGRDVFLNREVVGVGRTGPGLKVSFFVELNGKGEPQARDIKYNGDDMVHKLQHPSEKVFRGSLRQYNSNIGYGFITCDEVKEIYDHDVFLHKHQYDRIHPRLEAGENLQFKVVLNSKGQPQATELDTWGERIQQGRDAQGATPELQKPSAIYKSPPNGKSKWYGKARPVPEERMYTFLECDDAVAVFGTLDVYVAVDTAPELLKTPLVYEYYEFDIVENPKTKKPMAKNLTPAQPPSPEI